MGPGFVHDYKLSRSSKKQFKAYSKMSIKSDSSSSKIDQSPWGFSPTTAASVSFDNRDFKSITTIVGKVKEDWYPRGCVTMDRDKSRMTFDENGLANVLCSLGSFS